MRHSFFLAVVACFQVKGVDEPTASATCDQVGDSIELKYSDEGEARMPRIAGTKDAEVKPSRGGVVQPTFLFGGSAGKNDDPMKVLAGFLTAKQDSQFTRAWVNRVWGWLFGYGIVHPADDFNLKNKALSTGLLESPVRDTRDQNHSLKRLVRVICYRTAYRMPTALRPGNRGTFAFRGSTGSAQE